MRATAGHPASPSAVRTLRWEAPAVVDIHVVSGTFGGCPTFPNTSETTYTASCNIGPVS